MTALPYTSLITLLILLVFFATAANVGRARGKYGVKAPAVTGHEMFERAFRIQMNTLEGMVLVLPALWIFAAFGGDGVAAPIGSVWLLARIWYAFAYQQRPASRGPAFGLSMLAFAVLWAGAAWSVIMALLAR
jgi:glutathione S-transferase